MGLAAGGSLVLLLAWASGTGASANARTTSPAQQSLTHSLNQAKKAGSARITVSFFNGSATGKVVQDSLLHTGKQTVALKNELVSVVLLAHAAYITGDSKGLTTWFGLPDALVPAAKGHWISLDSTDAAFKPATANVTLPAALANVTPSTNLTLGKRSKVDKQWVRSISGEAPGGGSLVLFVTDDSRSLPIEAVESDGSGETARGEIVTFTRWGEKVPVTAPAGAIPLSVLETATPAPG